MSHIIEPPKGDAFCGFCKRNNFVGDKHEAKNARFRNVQHTSNGYQFYTFTICEQCAAALANDLAAFVGRQK